MASKREVELELQLWKSRAETVKAFVAALNAQALVLNSQSHEVAREVQRFEALLAAMTEQENALVQEAPAKTGSDAPCSTEPA